MITTHRLLKFAPDKVAKETVISRKFSHKKFQSGWKLLILLHQKKSFSVAVYVNHMYVKKHVNYLPISQNTPIKYLEDYIYNLPTTSLWGVGGRKILICILICDCVWISKIWSKSTMSDLKKCTHYLLEIQDYCWNYL